MNMNRLSKNAFQLQLKAQYKEDSAFKDIVLTRKEIPYERLLESQLIMGQTHTLEKFSILLLIISIVLLKINRKSFKIYYSND